jgi:PAS domain S-box-containing protein
MKIYESHEGMYTFKYLPDFARYILDHHLDEFVQDQISLSREVNLPLLRFLRNMDEVQLFTLSKTTTIEYLNYLAANRAKDQLIEAASKWLKDKLEVIGKFEISAEDITVFNYMRGRLFKKWIKTYPVSVDQKLDLIEEIDKLLFGAATTATNNFINILKHKIDENAHFNQQLINTSPGIIFIFDIVTQKDVYVKGNSLQVMGYTPEEVVSMPANIITELTHPDDIEGLSNSIRNAYTQNSDNTHLVEYRFKHRSGEYKWLRSYYTIFRRGPDGFATQILGTCFEITSEKETAFALAKRESQLLEAQSTALLGSYEWDIVSDISVNTPQLDDIFEFEQSQGQTEFMQKVHPQDKAKVEQAMANAFISGNYDCQYRYLAGSREKVLWARGVVVFKDAKPVLMRGTVQDITQLKKIEHELIQKTKELERSNESLQQFASIASHDLKEPLRKMSMYSDMILTLEQNKLSEASHASLEKVKASSIRMQNMIEDILSFSSITNFSRKQRVSLKKILLEALDILDDMIRERNAEIKYDDLPEMVVVSSQIRQLFQNLIANAIKFSKKDVAPVIEITHHFVNNIEGNGSSVETASQYLVISISDNGIGFKQGYSEKIFELFARLHSRAAYEGSGLGLSICKRITENHGGTIRAISQPDQGATFIVTIPDNVSLN